MSSSQEIKQPAEKVNSAASGVPHNCDRVYELNQKRGAPAHHSIEDWLQAEADSMPRKEIKSEQSNHKAA